MPEQPIRFAVPTTLIRRGVAYVEAGGVPICLTRDDAGTHAFVSICSHEDRVMKDLCLADGAVDCPFHHVLFDRRSGEVLATRGRKVPVGMPKLQAEVHAGVVEVRVTPEQRRWIAASRRRWLLRRVLGKRGKRVLRRLGWEI